MNPFLNFASARWIVSAVLALLACSVADCAQFTIEAKLVEFADPSDTAAVRNLVIGSDVSGTNAFVGILTPSRHRELIRTLEARTGVDILSAPKVTTLSGRQAQIKVADLRYIVTELDFSAGPTNEAKPLAEPFELGPVVDVVPVLRPDGISIELTVIASTREFAGYDLSQVYFDSGPPRPLTPTPIREYLRQQKGTAGASNLQIPDSAARPPRPIFRLRQAKAAASVWDGQTLVLGMPVGRSSSANPNLKFLSSTKACFLFLTPVLIDPTGNRLNDESRLPFVDQTIPK